MRRALGGPARLGVRGPGPYRPARLRTGPGRPSAGSEFRGKWAVGEGLDELLRVVVSSGWWFGGAERRG